VVRGLHLRQHRTLKFVFSLCSNFFYLSRGGPYLLQKSTFYS
jgi:hypothetical protein